MKKIFLLFILYFVASCGASNQEIVQTPLIDVQKSNDTTVELSVNSDSLIDIYKNNKELTEKIADGSVKTTNGGAQFFLDGLNICQKIALLDLNNQHSKESFLKEVGLLELYSQKKVYAECVDGTEVKTSCKINENTNVSDILVASFFSGKTSIEDAKKYLGELSDFYADKEKANSIILKILQEKISGKNIDNKYCEDAFYLGYKGFFNAPQGDIQ